jgi:uncharacterized membrane protein YcaP (DUF421 family)
MEKEEIHLWDVHRILFGDAPVQFLLEVVARTIIIYCILLIVIRLLGKRMSGQLTSVEMAVMLTLGAIVSVPMQDPARGLLQGILLLTLILIFQKSLSMWMTKNSKVEDLVQGKMLMLVKNGTLQLKEMQLVKISREQLFSVLRGQQVFNLGKVKRLYLEACGDFSTYKEINEKPGLSIMPEMDSSLERTQKKPKEDVNACSNCGHTERVMVEKMACPECGAQQWEPAVI